MPRLAERIGCMAWEAMVAAGGDFKVVVMAGMAL